jgi:DNA repair exonuclease SbcCD ATPase subunit
VRLESLEIAGFRGIATPLRLSLDAGFVVFSGRNGSGKSTICDAIEFALTGSVSKYSAAKEDGENLSDYLWWRGRAAAPERYVRLNILKDDGELIEIARSDRGLLNPKPADIEQALCELASAPPSPLAEMCRTSIMRDEWIASSSVDLTEIQRFEFVRTAVGSAEFAETDKRLGAVLDVLKTRSALARNTYTRATDDAKALLRELGAARTQSEGNSAISNAAEELRKLLRSESVELAVLLGAAETAAGRLRNEIEQISQLRVKFQGVSSPARLLELSTTREKLGDLERDLESRQAELTEIESRVSVASSRVEVGQKANTISDALAGLYEHGSRIGLRDGHCPLCLTTLSDSQFQTALSALRSELDSAAKDAADASATYSRLSADERALRSKVGELRREAERHSADLAEFERKGNEVAAELLRLGVPPDMETQTGLETAIADRRSLLNGLQQHSGVVRASIAASRVIELERDYSAALAKVSAAEAEMNRVQEVAERIRRAASTVKRVAAEAIDNRLEAIRPLLTELYSRLRPHADWSEVSYHIRGDVRRFLSLRVGEDLNLRFMFSSGQRRAAGLAFLLSVALSRGWCNLRSLVLDDPVQHVDDFRALHLVETLAAIRQRNWQIVCCVEDPQLARLLQRRLRSSEGDEGLHIRMAYTPGKGVHVDDVDRVRPFPQRVLQSA